MATQFQWSELEGEAKIGSHSSDLPSTGNSNWHFQGARFISPCCPFILLLFLLLLPPLLLPPHPMLCVRRLLCAICATRVAIQASPASQPASQPARANAQIRPSRSSARSRITNRNQICEPISLWPRSSPDAPRASKTLSALIISHPQSARPTRVVPSASLSQRRQQQQRQEQQLEKQQQQLPRAGASCLVGAGSCSAKWCQTRTLQASPTSAVWTKIKNFCAGPLRGVSPDGALKVAHPRASKREQKQQHKW